MCSCTSSFSDVRDVYRCLQPVPALPNLGQSGTSALVSLGALIANSDGPEHVAVDSVNDAAQRPTEMT